ARSSKRDGPRRRALDRLAEAVLRSADRRDGERRPRPWARQPPGGQQGRRYRRDLVRAAAGDPPGRSPRLVETPAHLRLGGEGRDDAREAPTLPGKRGLAGLLTHEAAGGQALRPGLGHGVWVPRIGLVIARDDERRHIERLQLREPVERQRAWNLSQRTRDGL